MAFMEEVGETGARGDEEDALGLVVGLADAAASGGLGGQGFLGLGELVAGVAEEDEAEDGDGVFGGLQLGVGPELVGGVPEALFQVVVIGRHAAVLRGALPGSE